MEVILLLGCLLAAYGPASRLPLSLPVRVGTTLVLGWTGASLIGTVMYSIAASPWLLLVLPALVFGMMIGGLVLWRRYGIKAEDNPFKPF